MAQRGRLIYTAMAALTLLFALAFLHRGTSIVSADAAAGKAAYDRVCAVCHGFEGKGGPIAPPLAKDISYFKDVGIPMQGVVPLLVQAPRQRPPGSIMPVYGPDKITDAELADVTEYLWSLTPQPAAIIPPGDAQKGAAPYATNCAGCHGAKGEGVIGPPLAAIAAGLKAGGAPAPVMHALVRLAALSGALPTMPTLKLDNATLADIAAYVWELPPPAAPPPAAPPPAAAPSPKDTYNRVCAVCHGLEGKGGPIAPPLAKDISYFKDVGIPMQGVVPLLMQAARQRPPGSIMPVYGPDKISDAELANVADYLWSLTPQPAAVIPPGDAQKGAAPYATNCAGCHGAKGEGGIGPPLAAIAAGLKAGGAPAPVMHALVRLAALSGSLPDMPTFKLENATLADIAAYIWELPPPGAPPAALPKTGDPLPVNLLLALGAGALLVGMGGLALRRRRT